MVGDVRRRRRRGGRTKVHIEIKAPPLNRRKALLSSNQTVTTDAQWIAMLNGALNKDHPQCDKNKYGQRKTVNTAVGKARLSKYEKRCRCDGRTDGRRE